MKPKRLVIDDVRTPSFDAVVVRTAFEGLDLIRGESWDEVWLDHDLDMAPARTPDVSWLTARLAEDASAGRTHDVGMFVLHSANSSGRQRMARDLDLDYLVLHAEDYPDKGLALTGGGVVEIYTDARHEKKYRAFRPVAASARSAI